MYVLYCAARVNKPCTINWTKPWTICLSGIKKKILHFQHDWIPNFKKKKFSQSITKVNGCVVVIRGMQLFPAAHSNTFPFIPLIFLERQFPPCTRASHILCKVQWNSTLPFTLHLCSQFEIVLSFLSIFRELDSSLFLYCTYRVGYGPIIICCSSRSSSNTVFSLA